MAANKRAKSIAMVLSILALVWATPAFAVLINVPGTSNPWLAGMPDGTPASSGDVAPTHSPVLVTGIDVSVGGTLNFFATGGVLNFGGCDGVSVPPCAPPDGAGGFFFHFAGAEHGKSNTRAPANSLLGVFLDDIQPNLTPAPATLDFLSLGIDFPQLSPELKQVFFIGDGLNGGSPQDFFIPPGATRLFLGTLDGFGSFNNTGSFNVQVDFASAAAPEPASLALLALGLLGLGMARRSKPKP